MITPAEMRRAEHGIKGMLAKDFRPWIAQHAGDLLSQATIEYAEWLKDNRPASNPVGWLLNCAYWRALNLCDAERRKPYTSSLDTIFHLADKSTPTPEQQVLDADLRERLLQALSHLPDKERKLFISVYYEDASIREAGRRVGWQKSAADRHHTAALEKMRALVGDLARPQ